MLSEDRSLRFPFSLQQAPGKGGRRFTADEKSATVWRVELEAARAYNEAAKEALGEFARLNDVRPSMGRRAG